ncbi:MAG TPA: hypothetical protein VJX73_15420 [Terracidiphilus sp.]|nr:hypothetical protein [Terracidiphilus sp.]
MQKLQAAAFFAAGSLLAATFAMAAEQKHDVQASTVITILPENEMPGGIPQEALHLKLDGKESAITGFTPLRDPQSKMEMVVLIDDGARSSLGLQMNDIAKFIESQRPDTKVAIAYMENGRAALGGPLTTDHESALRGLHLPMAAGGAGISGSPYFCLSNLAKNWPSNDARARREVVMITDGVDYYDMRYDPEDPYVQTAMDDAVRARLIVYAIYWTSGGRFDRTNYGAGTGQNLLAQVTQGTGGVSYWEGTGNPVSFVPYFADIDRRLNNQYELDFMTAVGDKPQMQTIRLTVSAHAKITAPQEVYVHPSAE